jgi:uncharacterized protein YggE
MNQKSLILLSFFLSIFFVSCFSGHHKPEVPNKIEVTGSAEMEVVPDEIYMTFTLKEYLDKAKQKVKLESIKTEFLQLCKKAGVSDTCISIASYTGNERWDYYWYKRRKTEPDFMSSISYSIKVSTPENLDKIVNGLNENAVEGFNITKTSHSKIEQFRKEVKTKALIATRAKAEYLAESIDEEIGEALIIQEIENSSQNYYSYSNESNYSNVSQTAISMESGVSQTPNFQKIKLRYEMKAEFRLK